MGAEVIDDPVIEGIMYVMRQNFGRYLIVIIERDFENEENDLALSVWVAEAEEITAEEADIQSERSESER